MNRPSSKHLNHVIFLGAGASYTSGYPIGQELRLQMASKSHFEKRVKKLYGNDGELVGQLLEYFNRFAESIELFRHGGFATVDEFSKLASGSYPEHVQNMKMFMRLVLALHNPEDKFHKSDYYPFIQRLFRSDDMIYFRNEIAIITFNYDCYLDFVMREAYRYRLSLSKIPETIKNNPQVLKGPQELFEPWNSKLSSGFSGSAGDAWKLGQFNYFKLHGSITYGGDPISGYQPLFAPAKGERFKFLKDECFQRQVPPIVFPWELFSSSGEFISEDEFPFVKGYKNSLQKPQDGKLLFNHFKSMWENAKQVVQQANKISFVGLSMHEYLEGGFKYLFQDFGKSTDPRIRDWIAAGNIDEAKPKEVQVVVANPENEHFRNVKNIHPSSLRGKVADLLKKAATNLKYVRSWSEDDGMLSGDPTDQSDPDITVRYSFKEFIEREMD
jgi:hypothetical protein